MANYGWMFATNGTWDQASRWKDTDQQTTGTLPVAGDDVFIMGAAVVTVGIGSAFTVQDLNLATYTLPSSVIVGSPTVVVQDGTLVVAGDVNDTYTIAGYVPPALVVGGGLPPVSVNGGGVIDLINGATLSVGGTIASGITVNFFDGAGERLVLGGFQTGTADVQGPITGFTPGDAIDLTNVPFSGADQTYDAGSQSLLVTEGGTLAAALPVAGVFDTSSFRLDDDGSGGTLISSSTAAVTGPLYPVTDVSTGVTSLVPGAVYSGPVSYLTSDFFYLGNDNVTIVATTPSVFIKAGPGDDAVQVVGGQNVVDGGTGSNFLVAGTLDSTDTFFLDGRGGGVTWDTVVNFVKGDMVTLWGWDPSATTFAWAPNEGATSFTGETIHASLAGNGTIDASITLAGATDTSQFTLTTGVSGGAAYAAIIFTG